MRIGFTGSRHGITAEQIAALVERFALLRHDHGATELHHGDCVGGDAAAAACAREVGLRVVGHPPNNPQWRAWFPSDEIREPLPFLDRDRKIVEAADVLVACPRSREDEARRSGTWYTIRHARRARIGLMVFAPSGVLVEAFRPGVSV
jgi:hypothetical protein